MKDNVEEKKQLKDDMLTVDGNFLEAELLYRTLFEQSPDGVLIIDSNGSFIEFNNAAHHILGYTREEFAQLHISDINLDSA